MTFDEAIFFSWSFFFIQDYNSEDHRPCRRAPCTSECDLIMIEHRNSYVALYFEVILNWSRDQKPNTRCKNIDGTKLERLAGFGPNYEIIGYFRKSEKYFAQFVMHLNPNLWTNFKCVGMFDSREIAQKATSMLMTDVGDEMCCWQLKDVFDHFGHQHPLSFYISIERCHQHPCQPLKNLRMSILGDYP